MALPPQLLMATHCSLLGWLPFLSPAALETGSGISHILRTPVSSRLHQHYSMQCQPQVPKRGLPRHVTALSLNCGGRNHNPFTPVYVMILKV